MCCNKIVEEENVMEEENEDIIKFSSLSIDT